MNRCPDLMVCLKRDLQLIRPEASLVLIYRPNVVGMKGRLDVAQPVNRTPDLWCGSTIHYHSTLLEENVLTDLPDDQHSFSKDKNDECVSNMHTQKNYIKEIDVSPLIDHQNGDPVETRNSSYNIHGANSMFAF
ncbi:hypothetical protein TNCV_3402061 [Trichonephila clavipes]|nr:hypothetical protein TNCV_3402061 [Trichonephila clavipes]